MIASVLMDKQQIQVKECEVPALQEHEILIKVKAAGICGTDVHIYYGMPGATEASTPVVLGHEFSGIVIQCGKGVTSVNLGDLVSVDPNIYCGKCDPCHNSKKQFCEHMSAIGVNQNGGFEEYCIVPEKQVIVVDSDTDPEEAAMAEPVACCLHGIDNIQIQPGDYVCVIGGGAIGQIMCQLAKLSGAAFVALSEPIEGRRKLAIDLGADAAIDPTAGDLKNQLMSYSGRPQVDVVIECVGKPAASSSAVDIAARGGKILIFSVPLPGDKLELPLEDVFHKELTIKGSFVNPDTQLRAIKLISAHRLKLKPLITHRYPIELLDEAIKMQMAPESVKVMVIP